jgi:hypothetical protein
VPDDAPKDEEQPVKKRAKKASTKGKKGGRKRKVESGEDEVAVNAGM